jgi:hypothetical protein
MTGMSQEALIVAHRVEITRQQDGKLSLDNLPFHAGEAIGMILAAEPPVQRSNPYPLRGAHVHYDRPFEPVVHDEWSAA